MTVPTVHGDHHHRDEYVVGGFVQTLAHVRHYFRGGAGSVA
jgi:hypothetical protein